MNLNHPKSCFMPRQRLQSGFLSAHQDPRSFLTRGDSYSCPSCARSRMRSSAFHLLGGCRTRSWRPTASPTRRRRCRRGAENCFRCRWQRSGSALAEPTPPAMGDSRIHRTPGLSFSAQTHTATFSKMQDQTQDSLLF